jgi:hypothetical protein
MENIEKHHLLFNIEVGAALRKEESLLKVLCNPSAHGALPVMCYEL